MNPASRSLTDPEGLALDISRLELDRDSADMVFVVGREEVRVSGHAAVFNVRCSKFVDLVSNHTEENPQPGSIIVRLDFLNHETFLMFVHFVYSGQADCVHVSVVDLLAMAILFGVPSLESFCQAQLDASLSPTTIQNLLNDVSSINPEAGDKQTLARPILQYISENISLLRDRQALDQLSRQSLELLVSSAVLQPVLSEAEIWRLCLRWARLQTGLDLTSPPRSWNDQERNKVRLVLEGIVQHVRLLQVDSNVFAEEVEPTGAVPMEVSLERYKLAALPEKFQQTRIERPPPPPVATRPVHPRLNPRAEVGPVVTKRLFACSQILGDLQQSMPSLDYTKLLNSWSQSSPSQSWRLVFRASEHNFSTSEFHRLCAGSAPTITILRSTLGCVSGAFTDVPWALSPSGKGRYLASESSFLFSLVNLVGLPPTKFPIKKKLFAVSHHPDCGPVYGAGADLFICHEADQCSDSYSNLPHSYDGPGASSGLLLGDYSCSLSEYEVLVPANS